MIKPIEEILEKIELPESAYTKAIERYKAIGDWLGRSDSKVSVFNPHIGPQGSFNIGTAIKPIRSDEYDLDLYCALKDGLNVNNTTQEQLKNIVGEELKAYAKAQGIKSPVGEKRRCWRIDYADGVSFHIDILPAIPHSLHRREKVQALMLESGQSEQIAKNVSELTMAITDNSDQMKYSTLNDDWPLSNPEGFAIWFRQQMEKSPQYLNERAMVLNAAKIEDVPIYRWKTPLQKVVQLLKRHRDVMFENKPDSQPISIIITTLAARAYSGEADVSLALTNVLGSMLDLLAPTEPIVPNPVNPAEDFADKWNEEAHKHDNLRDNFRLWVRQASSDFASILNASNTSDVADLTRQALDVKLEKLHVSPAIVTARSTKKISSDSASPWLGR